MRLLTKLSTTVVLLLLSAPAVSAKIYPDDFLIPQNQGPTSLPTAPRESTSTEPFFFASDIPAGNLTRATFIDAVATRLYDADTHDNCFGDLVLSETYDYHLLFNDVSLDAPYASSVCVMMRNGITPGYTDGTFRPDHSMTVAEAAAVFGHIGGIPLRDSNHVKPHEAWYQRFMEAMRAVDREFTMGPQELITGKQLEHSLCVLKKYTPSLDPLGEFSGC